MVIISVYYSFIVVYNYTYNYYIQIQGLLNYIHFRLSMLALGAVSQNFYNLVLIFKGRLKADQILFRTVGKFTTERRHHVSIAFIPNTRILILYKWIQRLKFKHNFIVDRFGSIEDNVLYYQWAGGSSIQLSHTMVTAVFEQTGSNFGHLKKKLVLVFLLANVSL